jgi:periplasmic protein CpxP/Spy
MELRTKWLLRALIIVLPLSIAALMIPRALAWGRHHARPSSPEELTKHMERGLEHLLDDLDASDAQRAQATRIAEQRAPALFSLMGEGRALRQHAKAVLLADSLDQQALTSLRSEFDAIYARAADQAFAGLGDLAAVLTPAQRRELAERLARHDR